MDRYEQRTIRDCKIDLKRCEELAHKFMECAEMISCATDEVPAFVVDLKKYFPNMYEINYVKRICIANGYDFCQSRYGRLVIEKIPANKGGK